MDVVNLIEKLELHDVEVKHIIPVPGYAGRTTSVIIFMDKNAETYYWVTTSFPEFVEGRIYDITAKCDKTRGNRLSFVKKLKPSGDTAKSEQPDAEDVLLGIANY